MPQLQLEPQLLENTITCPAEAHFRMELWCALQSPPHHHGLSAERQKERKKNWTAAMKRAHSDRTNNAAAAWERRCNDLNAIDGSDNGDGGDASGDDNAGGDDIGSTTAEGDLGPKFWN
jgi:hypothetical protein